MLVRSGSAAAARSHAASLFFCPSTLPDEHDFLIPNQFQGAAVARRNRFPPITVVLMQDQAVSTSTASGSDRTSTESRVNGQPQPSGKTRSQTSKQTGSQQVPFSPGRLVIQ